MKKLYKSKKDRKIAGVCGGIAEYMHVDTTIVRLVCMLLILAYGTGLLMYILATIIMPEK